MRKTELNKNDQVRMPWKLLALGFLFIFNPNISIVDVLPDFIGYIIVSYALTNVAMICETLFEAKKLFERMILIDIGKYFAIAWIFGVETSTVRASSFLLWSFIFGTLEIVFLIPSYVKLFKGISELGNYYPNVSIHTCRTQKGKSYTEKIRNFTIFFVIFKAIMTALPEFTDFNKISGVLESNSFAFYRYIGTIRFLCCVPVLIIGIVWIINATKYFLRIAKDNDFNTSIREKYKNDVLPKRGIFAIKNVKMASWFMVVASVFTLDVTIDGVNILPDILMSVMLIVALVYFSKTAKLNARSTYIFIGAFSVFALASYVVNEIYLRTFTYNSMNKDLNAFIFYMVYVVLVALQGVFFVLMYSSLVKQIKKVTAENAGYVLGQNIQGEAEKRQIAEFQKEINRGFEMLLNFSVVYVISDVSAALYGAIYAFLRNNAMYLNIINTVCGLLFVFFTVRALDDLKYAVKTKYMLE